MLIELYGHDTYIYWRFKTFKCLPSTLTHCLIFPERLHTMSQEDDKIFIYTTILLLKRRVPSDFCTRRMHTRYVRKRNGFPAYVVMLCHVMWCFVPPWNTSICISLSPPHTLQAGVFCHLREHSVISGRGIHTIYIYIYIYFFWSGRWGGASVDGWEISREMVWLTWSNEMVSKNICLTRCVDVERRCRFRAVMTRTAEWSPTVHGGPNRQIVLHSLYQTYLNIIVNFIWNKFRLYLITIPSFRSVSPFHRPQRPLFLTSAVEGGEGLASRPGRPLSPGKTRYPLYRRLVGPQGRSGQVRKISPPTGIRSPDRPARRQSLYRQRHPAHIPSFNP